MPPPESCRRLLNPAIWHEKDFFKAKHSNNFEMHRISWRRRSSKSAIRPYLQSGAEGLSHGI